MRRRIAVFASALGWIVACASFSEGVDANGDADADADAGGGGAVDGSAAVDAEHIVEAAPSDGNPCSSRAAKFSGTEFFEITPALSFDPPQMTVEAWIFVPKSAANRDAHLVSHVGPDKLAGWALALTPGPNLVFHTYTGGNTDTLGGTAPASHVDTDRWVHVAVTRDGGAVQLIIDGNSNAPFSNTIKPGLTATENLTVGVHSLDKAKFFQGLIEEVRISKVVRQVSIARRTMDVDGDTVALWRFDEKDGDALDSSTQHNDLGEVGGPLRVCMERFADDGVAP